MPNYIEGIVVLFQEKKRWTVGTVYELMSHLMKSVESWGTH